MEQIYRIGIDHGYGNIKTAHHIFESGVIERAKESELAGMTVEYEGKFYEIGSTHKEYQMDKVWDEDYYILTLAALAKELKGRGLQGWESHTARQSVTAAIITTAAPSRIMPIKRQELPYPTMAQTQPPHRGSFYPTGDVRLLMRISSRET